MPFSAMPTRLTSRPRTIGRLDAPGANDEPVMPGFWDRTSPSVPLGRLLRSSSIGTTVTVANWSVTIGSVPGCGAVTTGSGGGGGAAGARGAAGRAVRGGAGGAGRAAGRRRWIGLGVVTTIGCSILTSGDCCARVTPLNPANDTSAELLRRTMRLTLMDM